MSSVMEQIFDDIAQKISLEGKCKYIYISINEILTILFQHFLFVKTVNQETTEE